MAHTADVTFAAAPSWSARLRPVLLWLAIGLALVGFFTIVTFPFDALHARLLSEVMRQTGAKAQVDVRRSVWPLGIEWDGLRLSQGDRVLVTIPRVQGVLSLGDALRGKPVVALSVWLDAKAAKPAAQARTTFAAWNFQRLTSIEGTAERVELSSVVGPPVRGGRGKSAFHFEGSGTPGTLLDGELEVDLNDLAVEQYTSQGFRLPEWGFTAVRAKVVCAQQTCRIGEFNGNGPDGSVSATGQVHIGASAEASRWDVALTLTCSQAFSQRAASVGGFPLPAGTPLRVKLAGPLMRPQLGL